MCQNWIVRSSSRRPARSPRVVYNAIACSSLAMTSCNSRWSAPLVSSKARPNTPAPRARHHGPRLGLPAWIMETDVFCQVPVPQGVKVATPEGREGPPDQVLIWMCHLDTPLVSTEPHHRLAPPPDRQDPARPGSA